MRWQNGIASILSSANLDSVDSKTQGACLNDLRNIKGYFIMKCDNTIVKLMSLH